MVLTDTGSCLEGPSRKGPICEVGLASDREQGLSHPCLEQRASILFHISRDRDLFILGPYK